VFNGKTGRSQGCPVLFCPVSTFSAGLPACIDQLSSSGYNWCNAGLSILTGIIDMTDTNGALRAARLKRKFNLSFKQAERATK
jgi:hypothetical protein